MSLKKLLMKNKEKPTMNEEGQIIREILWRDAKGKHVVVAGPFPYGFIRSMDADSVEVAAKRPITGDNGIRSRGETTSRTRYAKTQARYVINTHNEWGEISP